MFRIIVIFALWIGWSSYQSIRGKSIAPSMFQMIDINKSIDNMKSKKSLTQLIVELKQIHGDKYGYELVNKENYKNVKSYIPVFCKRHNKVFNIAVSNHLYQKQGCPTCAAERRKISNTGNVRKRSDSVYGVGINDYKGSVKCGFIHLRSYNVWVEMLKRCYNDAYKSKNETYRYCYVCDDWLRFSVFKTWFDENYIEGYQLDKDILVKGNKIYSPDTCCFVPKKINSFICKSDKKRGKTPIGVSIREYANRLKYFSYVTINGKRQHLGVFDTPEEAFYAYKEAKEAYIKEVAQEYYDAGKITKRVYDALMNYKVEITD